MSDAGRARAGTYVFFVASCVFSLTFDTALAACKPPTPSVVVSTIDSAGNFTVSSTWANAAVIKVMWRGNDRGTSIAYPFHNPWVFTLNAACITEPEELVVQTCPGYCEGTGFACSDAVHRWIAPPGDDPVVEPRRIDPGTNGKPRFVIDYDVDIGTSAPSITAHLIPASGSGLISLGSWSPTASGTTDPVEVAQPGTVYVRWTYCGTPHESPLEFEDNDCDDCEQNSCASCVGKPVRTSSGNMRFSDVDPFPGADLIPLKRTYDSFSTSVGYFGRRWSSLFDARVRPFTQGTDAGALVRMIDESGNAYVFSRSSPSAAYAQISPAPGTAPSTLAASGGGWIHTNADGRFSRQFDSSGRIARYANALGHEVTITYTESPSRPTRLETNWGRPAWIPTYNTNGQIEGIDFENLTGHWTYEYDGDRLTAAVSPAGTWREYSGAGTGDEWRITAILDQLGNVIETHNYDSTGRATDSYGSSGDIESIEYDLAGRVTGELITKVTYTTGRVERHYQRTVAGRMRTVEIDGGCPGCGTSTGTYVHERFHGNVTRHQGADGYITENVYDSTGRRRLSTRGPLKPSGCDPATDSAHCWRTPDLLAAATLAETNETVTTSYAYNDANWPQRVTSVTIASLYSTSSSPKTRTETFQFDAVTGETLIHTIQGWTGSATAPTQQTSITTTTLYDGTEGAPFTPGGTVFLSTWLTLAQPAKTRKLVDGPRPDSDVIDQTQYVHYPIDNAVPARLRGRLAAISVAGHITRFDDYDWFGTPTVIADPNGVETTIVTDSLGRRTSVTLEGIAGCTSDPLCSTDLTTSFTYHDAGPLRTEQHPLGGVTAYEYDSLSRLFTVSRGPSASDLREQIRTTYDPDTGKPSLEQKLAREGASWVEKSRDSIVYYSDGLVQKQVRADDKFVRYTYDPEGRVSSSQDEMHTTAANTTYAYDPVGRLKTVTQTLGAGSIATSYGYDRHDNLTSVTDPNGNPTTYLFDDFGQMQNQTSLVTGTTTHSYDLAGNLITTTMTRTDTDVATTSRSYDALNRVTTATSTLTGAATETVSWTYDLPGSPNGVGRLGRMSDPEGMTEYRYDRRGLLIEESRTPAGSFASTTSYVYDRDGNRQSIVYPLDGVRVDYSFDYAQRPVGLAATSSHRFEPVNVSVDSAEYAPFGPLTKIVFGNGTVQTMPLDQRYRLDANMLSGPAGVLAHHDYTFDARSNVSSIADLVDASFSRTFAYDDVSRLVTANSGPSLWGTGEYRYDAMGNMTAMSIGLAPVDTNPQTMGARDPQARPLSRRTTFSYVGTTAKLDNVAEWSTDVPSIESAGSHRVSSAAYLQGRSVKYDRAGNETGYFATRSYSARNLMARVANQDEEGSPELYIEYGYDGHGVRVRRTRAHAEGGSPGTQRYHYTADLQLLAVGPEFPPAPLACAPECAVDPEPLQHGIIWFAGRPVITFNGLLSNVTARYTFTDHLGTPILQTNQQATVVWHAEYEPFGNIYKMRVGERLDQPLRFPGQDVAMTWEGTEENYNIFRWYRAGWGRYTQADPLEFKGGINLFAYALENPLRYKDPLGLKVYRCCAPADVAGGLVNHCWIKTDKQQTQIGFANEGQPAGTDPGGACASPFFSQTQVQIYGGNKKGTTCTEITDVDEKCVDDATWTDKKGWGATNGAWSPWNQCQTWTNDILNKCKKKCPKNEPFPTPFGPCAKLTDGTTVCAGTGI